MDFAIKEDLLHTAKRHIGAISLRISNTIKKLEPDILRLENAIKRSSSYDRDIDEQLYYHHVEEKKILSQLAKSPYFVRCDIQLSNQTLQTIYFSKFSYSDEAIYSWVAPAASIRFNSPGQFTFKGNDGNDVTGTLLRKDNFMIVDRKILFMATESQNSPRELIYQEHFTKHKSEFVLPEIVEQMEKAQDKIIRSDYNGSYLISGPAGSGKTTLALHRVAYLLQSPDTEKVFNPQNVIVFVQDARTQKYFSQLLPDLGIYHVRVTTFDEWAFELLGLKHLTFQQAYIEDESARDGYEHSKKKALENIVGYTFENDIFSLLYHIYRDFMNPNEISLFLKQSKQNIIDRFDLAALMKTKKQEKGMLLYKAPSYKKMKNGLYKRTFVDAPLQYSLIVVDEAENYLKENIELIKSCVNTKTNSIIYVGDLAQQTLTNTIKKWADVQESFNDARTVVLNKVYRNTKQILSYISSLGYTVEIMNHLKEGNEVQEHIVENKAEEISTVRALLSKTSKNIVGILTKHESYLREYKEVFKEKNVHILTINEAQGVEFDVVLLVGVNNGMFNLRKNASVSEERSKVDKDLLYVALTRAMNELHILGNISLTINMK